MSLNFFAGSVLSCRETRPPSPSDSGDPWIIPRNPGISGGFRHSNDSPVEAERLAGGFGDGRAGEEEEEGRLPETGRWIADRTST